MKLARAIEHVRILIDTVQRAYTEPEATSANKAIALEKFALLSGFLYILESLEPEADVPVVDKPRVDEPKADKPQ